MLMQPLTISSPPVTSRGKLSPVRAAAVSYTHLVFKKNPIDALDQETLFTIYKFFDNNLNVSETARKLFGHRNTLVYRLEKIKKLTGLDLSLIHI